jgi:hypothetical protein
VAPWRLTDSEWHQLRRLLDPPTEPADGPDPGRPRTDDRPLAEACLFRHFHSRARHYRCFGWNELPEDLGAAPSTANRRFREWTASGS